MCESARVPAALRASVALGWILLCLAGGCGKGTPPESAELPMPMASGATPFIRPGLQQPNVESADEAEVELDADIIGVSVGDVHRAYLCSAMSSYDSKVINDLIDGTPVTVTFCDRTLCARAFTSKGRTEPLTVQLGGWSGNALMLLVDGKMIEQDSPELPFDEVTIERSTWGEWKKLHPDTVIYTGREAEKPAPKPAE